MLQKKKKIDNILVITDESAGIFTLISTNK